MEVNSDKLTPNEFMKVMSGHCFTCGQPLNGSEERLKELQDHAKSIDESKRLYEALLFCSKLILMKQGKIIFADDVISMLRELEKLGVKTP
jgi:hypothetical protein